MRQTRWVAVLTVTLLGASGAARANGENLFEPLDVFSLEWANDPRMSPDGHTIAYTRSGFDIMTDRRRTQIWLVDARLVGDNRNEPAAGNHRPLADRPGYSARFSPDGKRIAFLSPTAEGTELYMHWLEDNRTARISQLAESPSGLAWAPDGKWLAFTMFKPGKAGPLVKGPEAPEGALWAEKFKVFESVQYRADGEGYLRSGFTHVYVVPADGGAARQVTTGDFNHAGGFTWGSASRVLYVSANRNDDWAYEIQNTDLFSVDVDTSQTTALTTRYGPDRTPAASPDGRYLAYTGYDDHYRGYENNRLYVLDLSSGESRNLTPDLDRSVSAVVWSDNSRSVYVSYDDSGISRIRQIGLNGRSSEIAADLGGTAFSRPYSGGSFHAAAGSVVYTRGTTARPADLVLLRRGREIALTTLNADALDHKTLATVKTVRFPSSLDGREIEAWIVRPPGFNSKERYPLILEIHGGPFAAYGPHFSAEVQLYAAAGYVVVYANPRGSTGYGEAFANLIHHDYPGGDYADLMSAVDYAVAEASVDSDRLYVTGGSGGGILTAWIVTRTNRFKAAVAAKPVINWYSFVLTADGPAFFHRYWFASKPWEDPESYLARSPLHFVDRVTTPTMLLTGENDHRTPISEAEQFYQALKLEHVDAALVRVPGASHGIAARPSHLIGKVNHVLAWFERYAD